jgi:hypothetical protein
MIVAKLEDLMTDDERVGKVKRLLFEYLKSPCLRRIRDPHSVSRLAQEIVRQNDRGNSIWTKWDGQREIVAKAAVGCWAPIEDLRDFLNGMQGPRLTMTDVAQRLKALEEESYTYSNEGTDLAAILWLLREYVDNEGERLRRERQGRYERFREEERISREERLLSGADCKWTQLQNSSHWYCRMNGRTYRLSPTKDKAWNLYA